MGVQIARNPNFKRDLVKEVQRNLTSLLGAQGGARHAGRPLDMPRSTSSGMYLT
jgi:hypothetical protein